MNLLLGIILLVNLAQLSADRKTDVRINHIKMETVILNCTKETAANIQYWIEPDNLEMLNPGYMEGRRKVSADGRSLTIEYVDNDDLGEYYCLYTLAGDSTPIYSRVTLLLYVPTFDELYQLNFIVAVVASVIFLGLCLFSCLIYHKCLADRCSDGEEISFTGEYGGNVVELTDGRKSYSFQSSKM